MNEDNIQGMIGQAQLASGTPSVESTTSVPGMGFGSEQALSVFGQPKKAGASLLEAQYQKVLGMARKIANDRKNTFFAGGGTSGDGLGKDIAHPWDKGERILLPAEWKPERGNELTLFGGGANPSPSLTTPAPLPQIVNRRGMFGTEAKPSYVYNGMSVMLPDGIDINDSDAVRNAMQAENDYIDMLYGNNEEDF